MLINFKTRTLNKKFNLYSPKVLSINFLTVILTCVEIRTLRINEKGTSFY